MRLPNGNASARLVYASMSRHQVDPGASECMQFRRSLVVPFFFLTRKDRPQIPRTPLEAKPTIARLSHVTRESDYVAKLSQEYETKSKQRDK